VVVPIFGASCQTSGLIESPDRHEARGTQGGHTLTAASSLTRRNKIKKSLRAILPNNTQPNLLPSDTTLPPSAYPVQLTISHTSHGSPTTSKGTVLASPAFQAVRKDARPRPVGPRNITSTLPSPETPRATSITNAWRRKKRLGV
jgi:hypothetical protein